MNKGKDKIKMELIVEEKGKEKKMDKKNEMMMEKWIEK